MTPRYKIVREGYGDVKVMDSYASGDCVVKSFATNQGVRLAFDLARQFIKSMEGK